MRGAGFRTTRVCLFNVDLMSVEKDVDARLLASTLERHAYERLSGGCRGLDGPDLKNARSSNN